MVLEKQDSGISLESTDGPDRKMSESEAHDLLKTRKLSKNCKLGGSDTKLNKMRVKDDQITDTKDNASDNGIMSDIGIVGDNGLSDNGSATGLDVSDGGDELHDDCPADASKHNPANRPDVTADVSIKHVSKHNQNRNQNPNNMRFDAFSNKVVASHANDVTAKKECKAKTMRSGVARAHSLHSVNSYRHKHTLPLTVRGDTSDDDDVTTQLASSPILAPTNHLKLFGSGFDLDALDKDCSHTDLSAILGEQEELVPLHKTVCCALCRKKQERLKQQEQEQTTPNHKTHSVSDVSSVASSSRSSRSPWSRDPAADARPISDPKLRRALGGRNTRVNPRDRPLSLPVVKASDQKILEIMLRKKEEERNQKEQSELAHNQWQSEKQAAVRAQTLSEKRRSLVEERKRREMQRGGSDGNKKVAGGLRSRYSASESNLHHRTPRDHYNSEVELRHSHQCHEDGKCCDKTWGAASQRLLDEKRRAQEEKRRQNYEKRKSVEKRLEEQKREEQLLHKERLEKQSKELRRAQSMKELKDQETIMKSRFKNYQTRRKVEERLNQLKQQSVDDLEMRKLALEVKLKTAEDKSNEAHRRKDDEVRRKQMEFEHKRQKSREQQVQIDHDLESWRHDLLEYGKQQEAKAEEQARTNVLMKKKKALEDRCYREQLVKDNMKKLMEQENEWKADVEATIAMKDAKSKMLQLEKEEVIQESRALAHASQRLREELRSQYDSNELDRLSKQTALEQKVLNKTVTS